MSQLNQVQIMLYSYNLNTDDHEHDIFETSSMADPVQLPVTSGLNVQHHAPATFHSMSPYSNTISLC